MTQEEQSSDKFKVFVSTHPFGSVSPEPLEILDRSDITLELNEYGRKITPDELRQHLAGKDALIAGTEVIDAGVLDCAPGLKIIARVGIGLDNIDFDEVNRRGIVLTYTPEAVSQAVAELTVAQMLNLARSIVNIHTIVKSGGWKRIIGFEIMGKTIGLIGFGRVGQRVARMLQGFGCRVLVNDLAPDQEMASRLGVELCSKELLYRESDIISLHVPRTPLTVGLISAEEIAAMKPTACLINTSRGGIVDEAALCEALTSDRLAGTAVDVYETEPYCGPLLDLDNVVLTAHSGSCSIEARYQMEIGAAREIEHFVDGKAPIRPVPPSVIKMERSTRESAVTLEWQDIFNVTSARSENDYGLYRSRWNQYPAHDIVGQWPLNIDIELVHNPLDAHCDAWIDDYFQSPKSEGAVLMEMSLFEKIIEEYATIPDPAAIKLGVRGCAVDHDEFGRMLEMIHHTGCVETISSITLSHMGALEPAAIEAMVDHRLDVLNIYLDTLDENDIPFEVLAEIRKRKSVAGHPFPTLRVVGKLTCRDRDQADDLVALWSHWADAVALSSPSVGDRKVGQDIWDCSRLWQRIMISAEGVILPCSFDIAEEFPLGRFGDVSIQQAWLGERMTRLRAAHAPNSDHCCSCSQRRRKLLEAWGC
ncbi:MAG: NAD(P)-dependent oxidoreductase [Phycisphaerae bacterium]|jgi:D-3-phosphoglycerate dehydrogenase|nr:NAD(P)-dependent oxidoreductase [Phycisphaerae bacterium]